MLQNLCYLPPEIATIEGLYTGLHLYFWYAGVILQFILAVLLIVRSKNLREVPSLHSLILAYAYFFIAIAINRIFFIQSYFYEIFIFFSNHCNGLGTIKGFPR